MEHAQLGYRAQILNETIQSLRDLCADDDGSLDNELLADMVEGETNLEGFVSAALEQIANDNGMSATLSTRIKDMQARKKRFDERMAKVRGLVGFLMLESETKKLELPEATVSAKYADAKIHVTDESLIPSKYWVVPDPKLDAATLRKDALRRAKAAGAIEENPNQEERIAAFEALEQSEPEIPGIEYGNAEPSVTIRSK